MFKIGVMGGRETVMGFKALGLDTYPVDNAEEAKHPGRDGSMGLGLSALQDAVERAVGTNIL